MTAQQALVVGGVALGLLTGLGHARAGTDSWVPDVLNPRAVDRKDARKLAPVDVESIAGKVLAQPGGEARVIKLRVYADSDYRGAVIHWQVKFRAQVARLNRVIEPLFNATFEVESLRAWNRSHVGAGFEELLSEIEAVDPARDVDWVVGLVTSFKGVATSIHQVGGARLLSRHFVMRAMDDAEEAQALARRLDTLPVGEREALYQDRKAHKELVVFLHEWAHSMGALHVDGDSLVMNPAYDARQARFTDYQRRLISLVLERRLAERGVAYPESAALLALLQGAPANEGMTADRAALERLVRARISAPTSASAIAAVDAPANVDDLAFVLDAAIRSVVADDLVEATPLVLDAAQKFRARATPDPRDAFQLAQVAAHVGALTVAEDALQRANHKTDKAKIVAGAIAAIRRQTGLPRASERYGIAPDDEPAYVASYREVALLAVQADKKPIYQQRLGVFAERYPETPGARILLCERDLRAGRTVAAEKNCQLAVSRYPDCVRGHYLLGLLAERGGRISEAEKALRRALLLDPEDPAMWRELGRFYERTHNALKARQLESERRAIAAVQPTN